MKKGRPRRTARGSVGYLRLEDELQTKLQLTGLDGHRSNVPHRRGSNGGVHTAELGLVEHIEGFQPELGVQAVLRENREHLEERGVDVCDARVTDAGECARGGAEGQVERVGAVRAGGAAGQ